MVTIVCLVMGWTLISAGLHEIYPPLGIIWLGLGLVAVGLDLARPSPKPGRQ